MKLLIISVLLSVCQWAYADKLSSRYLPPSHAASSGGHGSYLQIPNYQQQSAHYQGAGSSHYSTSSAGHQTYNSHAKTQIPILRESSSNDGNGNYHFGFETANGIRRDESGVFHAGHPEGSQAVTGSYSFVGDDGQTYTVNYRADHNGFHAEGAHLPTPPPIPKEIQDSLALHQRSHHGGGSSSYNTHSGHGSHGGYGAHHAASASSQQPAYQYLPPQATQRRGYNYGPGQY